MNSASNFNRRKQLDPAHCFLDAGNERRSDAQGADAEAEQRGNDIIARLRFALTRWSRFRTLTQSDL